ncbi:hypothetical protein BKA70DRAFT_1437560 [Coprinopsis sp. MPI-PUGE-AT-0042]|nr:hypothetical protein BKA70DRAFT_1437560 [Coprinopsis sp. MPI-PUGE-AT-0042]
MADEGAQQTETGVVAPGSPLTDLDCELDAGEQPKAVKTGSAGKKRQLDALRLFSGDEDDEPVVPQKKTSTRRKPTAIMSDSESDNETRVHEKSAPQAKRNTRLKAGSSQA